MFKRAKNAFPFYFYTTLERVKIMTEVYSDLKNIENDKIKEKIKELNDLIVKEYIINFENIFDSKKNEITIQARNSIIRDYKEYIEKANIKIELEK